MNAQTMIAVERPRRTAPIRRASHGRKPGSGSRGGGKVRARAGTAAVDPAFRGAAEILRAVLELAPGEALLSVAPGNTVTPLAAGAAELAYEDGEFDVVESVFGAMFAPDHRRMASELLRVCRPGGRIGLACWTPGSFNGELIEIVADYLALDAESAARWGERAYLDELFGDGADALGATDRVHTWRYPSAEDWLGAWHAHGGPLHDVYRALDIEAQSWLTTDLLALAARYNEAEDDTLLVHSEYLELLVHKSTWRE